MDRGRVLAILLILVLLPVSIQSCGCFDRDDEDRDATGSEFEEMERDVFDMVNLHRKDQGLADLCWSRELAAQCLEHSRNMASGDVAFSHDGFQDRVAAVKEELGPGAAAENVAYNGGAADPAATAVEGWLGSPGHRANIEGDYELTGVGIARSEDGKYYFTQMFYRPSS